MQYEQAVGPVSGAPAARWRTSGTTDTATRRGRPFRIKQAVPDVTAPEVMERDR